MARGEREYSQHYGVVRLSIKGVTMSDKSPKKNSSKTAATKSLKEKRLEKHAKSDAKAHMDAVSDIKKR